MPDSLADQIPEFDALQEGVTVVGLGVMSAVPILGGVASTVVAGALASQASRRNAELLRMIAEVVDDLAEQVEGWDAEAIASDPRFLAAAERVVRAAQGTADEAHRARLIHALRHAGPWSTQERYATERMTDLLLRLGPLHIFVLKFFADPLAWLVANAYDAWRQGTESLTGGSLISLFGKYVFPNGDVPPGEVARVVDELQRESLLAATRDAFLGTHMSGSGLTEPRLTEFGTAFLAFAEDDLRP